METEVCISKTAIKFSGRRRIQIQVYMATELLTPASHLEMARGRVLCAWYQTR